MYKGINKLAKLVKIMARDVSKEEAWWKTEQVGDVIGLCETDTFFDEISVTDDSGYRSITIGDTRGNVSRVNGRKISENEHMGYMLLYSENCDYSKNHEQWRYKCFPPQKEIAHRLQMVCDEIALIPLDKRNCDSEEYWYSDKNVKTLKYFASVVKKYADTVNADERSVEEIFESWKQ